MFRGYAWMAILSALFLLLGLGTCMDAVVFHDWFALAVAGVLGVFALTFAMLSVRE